MESGVLFFLFVCGVVFCVVRGFFWLGDFIPQSLPWRHKMRNIKSDGSFTQKVNKCESQNLVNPEKCLYFRIIELYLLGLIWVGRDLRRSLAQSRASYEVRPGCSCPGKNNNHISKTIWKSRWLLERLIKHIWLVSWLVDCLYHLAKDYIENYSFKLAYSIWAKGHTTYLKGWMKHWLNFCFQWLLKTMSMRQKLQSLKDSSSTQELWLLWKAILCIDKNQYIWSM